ncbi:GNAT family N-acetyltransferase [Neisseriaceae bacterium TC5R-5]|nr:GNAT family N-acetyltransferase [Neisseriaceae bacterium TC5R-5]
MRIEAASLMHLVAYETYLEACRQQAWPHYQNINIDAESHLQSLLKHAQGQDLPEGEVACQTWFLLDSAGQIIGAIRLRRADTPFVLDQAGHIEFEVLPAWRGQGFAKVLLQYVQTLGDRPASGNWVIVCLASNAAAIHTIESCGGQLLGIQKEQGQMLKRYSLTSLAD